MRRATLGAVCLMLVAGSVWAHHSPVVFDRTKKIEIVGVVKEFRWTNPHSWIHLEVRNDQGGVDTWSIEMGSPNHLVKAGWKRTTLAVGQEVTVQAYPLRDGEKGGQFISVTFPDGGVLTENDPLSGGRGPGVE